MGVLGKKVVRHSPWFIFTLWVILIAIAMFEAWAILLQNHSCPTWQYVLYLIGIFIAGICWLYGMYVSMKRQSCKNKVKGFSKKNGEE